MKFRRLTILFPAIFALLPAYTGCKIEHNTGIPVPDVPANTRTINPAHRLGEVAWKTRHIQKTATVKNDQKIIFIGDSITQLWEQQGYDQWDEMETQFGDKLTNIGFSGDGTQHVIWRMQNGEFPAGINPEYAVIKIGTNNVDADSAEAIAAGIAKIAIMINQISPQTKILICSILPRGNVTADARTRVINAVNAILKTYDGHRNIQFIDLYDLYLNPDGSLNTGLFTDNLHLTAAGYEIWKDKIMEVIGD